MNYIIIKLIIGSVHLKESFENTSSIRNPLNVLIRIDLALALKILNN